MNEYNTSRSPLVLREYGRNIQKLVEYIKALEDTEQRNRYASTLIELMKQVTPSLRDTPETTQKMWDDLFIMADFKLEIDSPYPMPEQDVLIKKPNRVPYSSQYIKFKHYGKNIELLIKEAVAMEDGEDKQNAFIYIGKLMKSFYNTWNKEVVDDAVILENMKALSGGKVDLDIDKIKEENLFETLYKDKKKPMTKSNTKSPTRQNNRSNNRNNNNNNNRRRRN